MWVAGVVERWLGGGFSSAGVEPSSAAVTACVGANVVGHCELDGEGCGVGEAERVAVEVAGLVGPVGGGDGPGPAGELSGDSGVG